MSIEHINQSEQLLEESKISAQREKMQHLESEKPELRKLFSQTKLFRYLNTPKLQNRFLNTVFYGMLAKESAFGTHTRHLLKSAYTKIGETTYLTGTKIPIRVFRRWIIDTSYNKHFQIPKATLKKYNLRSQKAARQLIEKHTINKGPYQITPINIKDISQQIDREPYKSIWNSSQSPVLKDRQQLEESRKLSVLSYERIYEMCKGVVSKEYFNNKKQSLVAPLIIMGYKCGGGTIKSLLAHAEKTRYKSNILNQVLDWGLKQNIIKSEDVNYLKLILEYRNQLQPDQTQQESLDVQLSQTIQNTIKQTNQLKTEIEQDLGISRVKQSPAQRAKYLDLPRDFDSLKVLSLDNQPAFQPEYDIDELDSNTETFGEFFQKTHTESLDSLSNRQIAELIIKQFQSKISFAENKAVEIHDYPLGIQIKHIHSNRYNLTNTYLKTPKNLKEIFESTPRSVYKSWKENQSYTEPSPIAKPTPSPTKSPTTQPAPIAKPTPAQPVQNPNKQPTNQSKQVELEEIKQLSEIETDVLTWADIFDEENHSINQFTDDEVMYFVIDTFMPERQETTNSQGEIIFKDTYPFGITVERQKNNPNSTLILKSENIKAALLKTPLNKFPRKPLNVDPSYKVL